MSYLRKLWSLALAIIWRPHTRFALYPTRPFDQECIKGSPRRPLDKHYSPSALAHMVIARKFAERAEPAKKSSHYRKLGWKWIFSIGPFQINKQLKVGLISIQCQHPPCTCISNVVEGNDCVALPPLAAAPSQTAFTLWYLLTKKGLVQNSTCGRK